MRAGALSMRVGALSMRVSALSMRGVQDIFIACMDGLSGFKEAFLADLKEVYQAATRESAEANLRQLSQKWSDKYAIATRAWQINWEVLATFFAYPGEIRRLIYTTNSVEGYHRQLRKVTKSKSVFPTPEAARKLLFLAHREIIKKWTMPIHNWPLILNQLVTRFEGRLAIQRIHLHNVLDTLLIYIFTYVYGWRTTRVNNKHEPCFIRQSYITNRVYFIVGRPTCQLFWHGKKRRIGLPLVVVSHS